MSMSEHGRTSVDEVEIKQSLDMCNEQIALADWI